MHKNEYVWAPQKISRPNFEVYGQEGKITPKAGGKGSFLTYSSNLEILKKKSSPAQAKICYFFLASKVIRYFLEESESNEVASLLYFCSLRYLWPLQQTQLGWPFQQSKTTGVWHMIKQLNDFISCKSRILDKVNLLITIIVITRGHPINVLLHKINY